MAEALLRARLTRDSVNDTRSTWRVESAGTWAVTGRPASEYAVEEMAQRGIDLRDHRAREVTREMVEIADVVLAMTHQHVDSLKAAFPDCAHKVYLLSEMIGQRYDVRDPYGGTRREYAHAAKGLERLIEQGYERIVDLVGESGRQSCTHAS
jgi:protein-tyrosine phosphatase